MDDVSVHASADAQTADPDDVKLVCEVLALSPNAATRLLQSYGTASAAILAGSTTAGGGQAWQARQGGGGSEPAAAGRSGAVIEGGGGSEPAVMGRSGSIIDLSAEEHAVTAAASVADAGAPAAVIQATKATNGTSTPARARKPATASGSVGRQRVTLDAFFKAPKPALAIDHIASAPASVDGGGGEAVHELSASHEVATRLVPTAIQGPGTATPAGGSTSSTVAAAHADARAAASLFAPRMLETGNAAPNVDYRTVDTPIWQYHPVQHACWKDGPAPYLHLARAFAAMEGVKGRIRLTGMLINMFRALLARVPRDAGMQQVNCDDVVNAVLLCLGCIGNPHEPGSVLKLGGSTVASALSETTGASRDTMSKLYVETGDLGDVAARLGRSQRTLMAAKPLTVGGVMTTMRRIAAETGPGCVTRKQAHVVRLLTACREDETRYIVRTLIANMRIGANATSVLSALARAVAFNEYLTAQLDGATSEPVTDGKQVSGSEAESSRPSIRQAHLPSKRAKADAAANNSKATAEYMEDVPVEARSAMDAAAGDAKQCFSQCPDVYKLVRALVTAGTAEMRAVCVAQPGIPVQPMLARITNGIPEVMEQCANRWVAAEYKYDGQRAQMHSWYEGDSLSHRMRIFSRNLEDTTTRWPDVLALLPSVARRGSCERDASGKITFTADASAPRAPAYVIDAELVAVEHVDAAALGQDPYRILPFQTLSTRGRKDVAQASVEVRVCVFAFDLIAVDGFAVTELPFRERRELLRALFAVDPGRFEFAHHQDVLLGNLDEATSTAGSTSASNPDSVEAVAEALMARLRTSIAHGCEGLMVKVLDDATATAGATVAARAANAAALPATYQPAVRSNAWLKVKKDYVSGMADTLDVVPIGGWYGNGRKAGWFSPVLLAVYNPDSEEWQSVCRCMSGFTDAFYAEMTAFFQDPENQLPTEAARRIYVTAEHPSVWFKPVKVWEIKGADLTFSPVHMAAAGILHAERGVGLRFPRFLRDRSSEKRPEDATSSQDIVELFRRQHRAQTTVAGKRTSAAAAADAAGPAPDLELELAEQDEQSDDEMDAVAVSETELPDDAGDGAGGTAAAVEALNATAGRKHPRRAAGATDAQ